MVKIKPFAGIRPPKELAAEVSSRPYDVLNSQEGLADTTRGSCDDGDLIFQAIHIDSFDKMVFFYCTASVF